MIHTLVIFRVQAGRAADFESGASRVGHPDERPTRVHRDPSAPLATRSAGAHGVWRLGGQAGVDRAHPSSRFKELFESLPLAEHTLSRSSFFEPVYGTRGIPVADRVPSSEG